LCRAFNYDFQALEEGSDNELRKETETLLYVDLIATGRVIELKGFYSIDQNLQITRSELLQLNLWRWLPTRLLETITSMFPSRQIKRNERFKKYAVSAGRKILEEQTAAGASDTTKKDVLSVLSEQ
jgi:hypothetical protein